MPSMAEMKAKFIEVKSTRGTSCICDFKMPFIWTVKVAGVIKEATGRSL